jgi:hypothetical protein
VAPAGAKYAALERAELNKRAVRLNLPLYWTSDKNKNGTVDPDEVTTLLFYPTAPTWSDGSKFTKEFEDAYTKLLGAGDTPTDGRKKLVVEDLDGAAPTLVESDLRALSADEKSFVRHMQALAKMIDDLYLTQAGVKAMAAEVPPDDVASQSLFRRNNSPKCATPKVERNAACSAIPGAPKVINDSYPSEMQKDTKFCEKIEKDPNAKKLLDPFVVVHEERGKLLPVSYGDAYKDQVSAIAGELRRAADEIKDPKEAALKAYLTAAAQSFTTNDWNGADEAWANMSTQNSKWYVRIAPDETYWEPCSHKAGFHLTFARVNGDSLRWQEKLKPVQQEMEDSLATLIGTPYASRKVTFHLPDFIDIVFNAGDDRDPVGATIGQSLPNWGPLVKAGKGRTVAMSNLYADPDSRADRRKKAESLLAKATMSGYPDDAVPGLLSTILHEATHNLGPVHEYVYKGKKNSDAFGGDMSSMLEELKAQTGGVFFVDFAQKKAIITPELAKQSYVNDVVWAFGHIARGMYAESGQRKPYSQLAAIQIGFWLDERAVAWDAEALAANGTDKGAFTIAFDKMPAATEKLMKLVGGIKASNDKTGAEELAKKYVDGDRVPQKLIQERILRYPQPNFVYALEM